MRFINAGDILPKINEYPIVNSAFENGIVIYKQSITLNLKYKGVPTVGSYIQEAGVYNNCWAIVDIGFIHPDNFKSIEWLDEYQSQPSSDQIAGMRKDMDMALEREKGLADWLEEIVGDYESARPDTDTDYLLFKIVDKAKLALASRNQSPSTGEQEEWNRNERYETRLALHRMIKVLETKDLVQTESNLRLVAQDILKKYSKPEDVLR